MRLLTKSLWSLGFASFLVLVSTAAEGRGLVDRIVLIVENEIVTLREIRVLEAYLRFRQDNSQSSAVKKGEGEPLLQEAYQEAMTRKLVLLRLRLDPDFLLARGRARQGVEREVQKRGVRKLKAQLEPYSLELESFQEMEQLTLAIQDYVKDKFRHSIAASSHQLEQYLQRHPELQTRLKSLSPESQEEVRKLVRRQLEYQNFLESYEKFVQEIQADASVLRVLEPEEL